MRANIDIALGELKTSIMNKPTVHMGDGVTSNPEIAEIFSVPRITRVAREMGASGGFALDLRTTDNQGRRWDFDEADARRRAMELVQNSSLN